MKSKFATLLIIIGLTACNWIPPGPNDPFCCKINGKKYSPESSSSIATVGSDGLQVTWEEKDGILLIRTRNKAKSMLLYLVFEDKIIKEGRIQLSNDLKKSRIYYTDNNKNSISSYLISKTGFIDITKKDGYLLTGTFEFDTYDPILKKEIKITKGIFNELSYYL